MDSGWKTLSILFALLAAFFAQTSTLYGGGEDVNPAICIWKGTITINRKGVGQPQQPKQEKGKTVTVTGSHTLNETVAIEVCGDPGVLYVKAVKRELQEDSTYEKREQVNEQLCRFPKEMLRPGAEWPESRGKYVPQTRRPGNQDTVTSEMHTKILSALSPQDLRDKTHIRLEFPDSSRFTISGSQKALAEFSSRLSDTAYDVCAETTAVKVITTKTGLSEQDRKSEQNASKQGWDTYETILHINPPQELLKQFSFEGPFTGLRLQGEKVIDKTAAPDFEAVETAVWDLSAESPCPDVYSRLRQDLAFAEAYAEKKVADFADSIKEYESLVSDRAYRINHGVHAPRGQDSSEIEAATDEQGQQSGMEELKQRLESECKPDIIYESIANHEDVHTRQQEQFSEYGDGKPRTWGLMEVSAYVSNLRMMINWLRENCPETNLSDAERRLRALEKIAERYMPD